jgi:hypothetical protein
VTKVERRKREDEPIQLIIHIYMEKAQGNCQYSYLIQTKMPVCKNKEQEGKTGPVWRLVPMGRGRT